MRCILYGNVNKKKKIRIQDCFDSMCAVFFGRHRKQCCNGGQKSMQVREFNRFISLRPSPEMCVLNSLYPVSISFVPFIN